MLRASEYMSTLFGISARRGEMHGDEQRAAVVPQPVQLSERVLRKQDMRATK